MNPQTLRIAAAVAIALLLQTAVVPHFSLWDVHAELLLAVTIATALVAGPVPGVVAGFVSGLLVDSLLGMPVGLTALAYGLSALGLAAAAEHASEIWWARALLGFSATIISVAVVVAGGTVLDYPVIGGLHAVKVAVLVGVTNAVLTPLIAKAIGRGEVRRESAAW